MKVKLLIMIKTITIDIINDKAIKLLQDLESLQLIRVRREKSLGESQPKWETKYKGAMQKQPLIEIDNQLNDLRNSWE